MTYNFYMEFNRYLISLSQKSHAGIFTKTKKPDTASGFINYFEAYAFTLPFTFAITSSAIPDGAGE